MYFFKWDKKTGGYLLTNQTGRYVANEIRPVFADELTMTELGKRFEYNKKEIRPLMWAKKNTYLIADVDEMGESIGREVAQLNNTQYGKPLSPEFFFTGKMKLEPVNIEAMVSANAKMMDIIVADAKRRVKELYDADIGRCDIAYIAFSGGKDSVVLLDICHRVLPLSVPVIFSDTDMELPDTYKIWAEIKKLYPEREFIRAKADSSALENWKCFAPPSRTIRWCCSVHKSTPAVMMLKDKLQKSVIKVLAFVGVRGDESYSRSFYEDATDGVKNASQLNRMPILDWGAHELWLYIFANHLTINHAYRKGLSRVGCIMCPESSKKYVWFVDRAYPHELKPYSDIIIETSNKIFSTIAEKTEFIGSLNWQARKSGSVLRDTITIPFEEHKDLTVTFQSSYFTKRLFFEWIKTLGTVVKEHDTAQQRLKLPNTLDKGIPFCYNVSCAGEDTVIFEFRDINEKKVMLPLLRAMMKKVSACIACRCCEAECPAGAITNTQGKLTIDGSKCTKCRKCYEIDTSCWRFKSMYKSEIERGKMSSINKYNNFGLREKGNELWISLLIELGEKFFPWHDGHALGHPKVDAASSWFKQALLINDNRKPTSLIRLFQNKGAESSLGWEFIWIALANNAMIVKWFVTNTVINKSYTTEQLSQMLDEMYPSLGKTTIKGGLAALKDMLTKSPLGGEGAVTLPLMKGRTVQSLTRKAKDVNSLTLLYSLYLIAEKTERSSFTVRELLNANEESLFVSPLIAFGILPDTFKRQCEGLRSKYPGYIETTFTHGNDELTIFPNIHSMEDIIILALGE